MDLPKSLPRTKTTKPKSLPRTKTTSAKERGRKRKRLSAFLFPLFRRGVLFRVTVFVGFNKGDVGFNTGEIWTRTRLQLRKGEGKKVSEPCLNKHEACFVESAQTSSNFSFKMLPWLNWYEGKGITKLHHFVHRLRILYFSARNLQLSHLNSKQHFLRQWLIISARIPPAKCQQKLKLTRKLDSTARNQFSKI